MSNGPTNTPNDIAAIPLTDSPSAQVSTSFEPAQSVDSISTYCPTVTPLSRPDAPIGELPSSGRGTNGRFLQGNSAAVTHGQRSRLLQENAAPWRAEQVAAIRADLGDDVSTLKGHTIEQMGNVLVVLHFLGGNLMAEGPLTGKGRQRASLTAYLQTLDRFMRLTQSVGLERVSKNVPNPADWLEGKA
jgi:hypothetical protein